MKMIFNVVRILLGLLFVFSGLIKLNDPLGLGYKIDEFFDEFGLLILKDCSLILSFVVITAEIIIGLHFLLNYKMKRALILTFLIVLFFIFLTGYAVFSGKIKSCGCFGDCIELTATQSFWKDIIIFTLLLLLLYCVAAVKDVKTSCMYVVSGNSFKKKVVIISSVLSILIQVFVFYNLPFLDCLPFKKNENVIETINITQNNSTRKVIIYTYEKNNRILQFSVDNFPVDFDSSYKYISRKDSLIKTGKNAVDFRVFDSNFNDLTLEILEKSRHSNLLLFVKDWSNVNYENFQRVIKKISNKYFFENGSIYIISQSLCPFSFEENSMVNRFLKFVLSDGVTIKTLSRSMLTLYVIKNGIIEDKLGFLDICFL